MESNLVTKVCVEVDLSIGLLEGLDIWVGFIVFYYSFCGVGDGEGGRRDLRGGEITEVGYTFVTIRSPKF
jgi:hypothetical protein